MFMIEKISNVVFCLYGVWCNNGFFCYFFYKLKILSFDIFFIGLLIFVIDLKMMVGCKVWLLFLLE